MFLYTPSVIKAQITGMHLRFNLNRSQTEKSYEILPGRNRRVSDRTTLHPSSFHPPTSWHLIFCDQETSFSPFTLLPPCTFLIFWTEPTNSYQEILKVFPVTGGAKTDKKKSHKSTTTFSLGFDVHTHETQIFLQICFEESRELG